MKETQIRYNVPIDRYFSYFVLSSAFLFSFLQYQCCFNENKKRCQKREWKCREKISSIINLITTRENLVSCFNLLRRFFFFCFFCFRCIPFRCVQVAFHPITISLANFYFVPFSFHIFFSFFCSVLCSSFTDSAFKLYFLHNRFHSIHFVCFSSTIFSFVTHIWLNLCWVMIETLIGCFYQFFCIFYFSLPNVIGVDIFEERTN